MMKKCFALLLALLMLLGLAGCGLTKDVADALIDGMSEAAQDTEELLPELPIHAEDGVPADETPEAVGEPVDVEEPTAPEEPAVQEETTASGEPETAEEPEAPTLDEDGVYTSVEDVALYIHLYGHLPDNFITKKEAQKLGWSGGSLEKYAPGKSIGGDRFGNYEGLLPEKSGRKYTECDIDTMGAKSRGAKRVVFSDDGLIYYTDDHYASFTLLYGEED